MINAWHGKVREGFTWKFLPLYSYAGVSLRLKSMQQIFVPFIYSNVRNSQESIQVQS